MSGEGTEAAAAIQQPVKVSAEQLGIHTGDEHDGQLEYDLGHLMAFDPTPLELPQQGSEREAALQESARSITQSLVARLFELPHEAVPGGRLAKLPAPTTPLPRAKPLPKPKALTKWQVFAQKKGIVKKKRSKTEYDEAAGEWRRRHGYKRVNDESEVVVIDAKPGDQVGMDPFAEMAKERKERVKAQSKRQVENLKEAVRKGGPSAIPTTLRLAAALPKEGADITPGRKSLKRKDMKDEIKVASRQAGVSTASMGKFDRRLKGEKEGERAPLGKKRRFASVTDTASEKKVLSSFTDKFLRERSDELGSSIDVKKAMAKIEADGGSHGEEKGAGRSKPGRKGGRGGKVDKRGSRDSGGRGGRGGRGGGRDRDRGKMRSSGGEDSGGGGGGGRGGKGARGSSSRGGRGGMGGSRGGRGGKR